MDKFGEFEVKSYAIIRGGMILITGGTGFIGQNLARHLVAMGKPVRVLLRPSKTSPNLPRGVPVEVAVCGLTDERGLRAALKDVDVVYHLAGTERLGQKAQLDGVDVLGTQVLVQTCSQARVNRFFFMSHLGADRASAFPVLKSKAICENHIVKSGLKYTIFRSAAVFGPGDQFTTVFASLLRRAPWFFLLPDKGKTMLQPIWVQDLVTCLAWCLEDPSTINQTFLVGGGEFFSFRQVIEILTNILGVWRRLFSVSTPFLRTFSAWLSQSLPSQSIPIFWLDYLASNRTCSLDTLPRLFGLIPTRFGQHLDYLRFLPVSH